MNADLAKWLLRRGLLGVALLIPLLLAGCPVYNVWSAEMQGRAAFAKAEQDRQILVRQAQAQRDAASMLAEAEIARSRGVAEANKIIGDSLKGNDAYLRYLWIDKLENSRDRTIVYVPTEAGLPILEAGRLPRGEPAPRAPTEAR